MKRKLLSFLSCPDCYGEFILEIHEIENDEVKRGRLKCRSCLSVYLIENYIPRFVESDSYTEAFSIEWLKYKQAHLDSHTGLNMLDNEFRSFLDFPINNLRNKLILDAGCGLGRFTEICLNYGGEVICVDMSYAIDAAYQNLNHRGNVYFLQADMCKLPIKKSLFDFVYSTGVLHHTPDPKNTFERLSKYVKKGGKMMIMVYAEYNKPYVRMVKFYRRFTTKLPKRMLLYLSYIAVPLYYIHKIPIIGEFVSRILIPVSVKPISHRARIGNTFDTYAPQYAFYFNHCEIYKWFEDTGFSNIKPVGPQSGVCFIGTMI